MSESVPMAPLQTLWNEGFPEVWKEISTLLYTELMTEAPQPVALIAPQAAQIAIAQTQKLGRYFGGISVYMPMGVKLDAKTLARRIVEGFSGNNHNELARRHGISSMRVRQIIDTHAKAKQAQKPAK